MRDYKIEREYKPNADIILFEGDRLDLMRSIPDKLVKLVITSPPYNLGKVYECKEKDFSKYLTGQEDTIREAIRVLTDDGSICWQVGTYVNNGEILPLDIPIYTISKKFGLKLRNRIVWHFGHGLHCSKRFSGRYETILWFTKTDLYTFNLDAIRIPQKYPEKKHYKKNEKYGTFSCNPLGKNPSDVWEITNVKYGHPEKTIHPCQFPITLVERLILSMTNPGDIVLDPYLGVGSTICAAIIHNRIGYGSEIRGEYLRIAEERILQMKRVLGENKV